MKRTILFLALLMTLPASARDQGGLRPPENATPEERRAFWQQRAAERAKAESGASAPAGGAPAGPPRPGTDAKGPSGGKPGERAANGARPAGMSGMAGLGPMGGGPGGALWLSDTPPYRGDGARSGRTGGMGGMEGMGGERKGPPVKRLWLRAGFDPQKSGFVHDEGNLLEIWLVTPQGKPEGEALKVEAGKRNLSFEMPAQGFYRVYATRRKVQGDVLTLSVAKAEISNFSHGGDEEEQQKGWTTQRVLEAAPIEIVRERAPDEKRFFQLKSGEEQGFVVLMKGGPVQGARVRFVSHQGWSKEAVTDEQGRVSFQIIRDYFPPWGEFQKRFKATWLLIADADALDAGRYQDQPYTSVHYQATLSGNYYPSPDDYRSYAWGLGIGTLALLFSVTVIYLYRRRRVRPYREVRLDDAR